MDVPVALRCSPAIRALGVDPCGTAVGGTSFLLVEHPLPWPRDLSEVAELAPVREAMARQKAAGRPWRLQGLVPPEGASDEVRVAAYELPAGGFERYRRIERTVPRHDAIAVAVALVEQGDDDGSANGEDPAGGGDPPTSGDLLVCTHGRRDACCGGPGTALWRELADDPALAAAGLRVLRTSHTGGHRFAPTAIHLPTGTCWGWLDADLVHALVARSGTFGAVADRYRGSTALATPAEQVVERAAFAEVGWAWLDHRRTSTVTGVDGLRTTVEITAVAPGAQGTAEASTTWRGTVEVTGTSPVPECGGPLDEAPKHAPVLELVAGSFGRVGP